MYGDRTKGEEGGATAGRGGGRKSEGLIRRGESLRERRKGWRKAKG